MLAAATSTTRRSYFVRAGSMLDGEARDRCTSVYLTDRCAGSGTEVCAIEAEMKQNVRLIVQHLHNLKAYFNTSGITED